MSAERWELRHPDGTPADQRVIGIVGDNATVVAGVPYGADEEKRRAALMVAAPDLLAALRALYAEMREYGIGHYEDAPESIALMDRANAAIDKAEGRS